LTVTGVQTCALPICDDPIEVAIDFQGLLKSGTVMRATRAQRRVGFATAELREPLSRLFLTEQVDTSSYRHVIEKNLVLARAAARSEERRVGKGCSAV